MEVPTGNATVIAAVIAAAVSLGTSLFTLFSSVINTPLKYWFEKRALRNKLAIEHEYAERRRVHDLINNYRGKSLEAAEALSHRMWNLYKNEAQQWLDVQGRYDLRDLYYFRSFVHSFLHLLSLTRMFEVEALYINPKYAEDEDLVFVKFMKAIAWVACDPDLFDGLTYDASHSRDHFFRDELRATHVHGTIHSSHRMSWLTSSSIGQNSIRYCSFSMG